MLASSMPLAALEVGGTSLAPDRRAVTALEWDIIGIMLQAPSPSVVANRPV